MSKSILKQLSETVSELSDPNAIFNEEVKVEPNTVIEDIPLIIKEDIQQMQIGDGFEALLEAYNNTGSTGSTGKKVFLNLLQDNGIITIVNKAYIYN